MADYDRMRFLIFKKHLDGLIKNGTSKAFVSRKLEYKHTQSFNNLLSSGKMASEKFELFCDEFGFDPGEVYGNKKSNIDFPQEFEGMINLISFLKNDKELREKYPDFNELRELQDMQADAKAVKRISEKLGIDLGS